jgi:hypothetical protein
MDPGTAAVLGAVVGAVGTGLFGLASARIGARAQRQQTEEQRRFEQARARRESRTQAYVDLLTLLQSVGTRVLAMVRAQSFADRDVRPVLDDLGELLSRCARVQVEGPKGIDEYTAAIVSAVVACRKTLMALSDMPGVPFELAGLSQAELVQRCRTASRSMGEALDAFVSEARMALGNDSA